MRTYRQYCAVAKALDVVGDRWTMLIIRELILRGACRYTDIREGLPGVATTCSPTACASSRRDRDHHASPRGPTADPGHAVRAHLAQGVRSSRCCT